MSALGHNYFRNEINHLNPSRVDEHYYIHLLNCFTLNKKNKKKIKHSPWDLEPNGLVSRTILIYWYLAGFENWQVHRLDINLKIKKKKSTFNFPIFFFCNSCRICWSQQHGCSHSWMIRDTKWMIFRSYINIAVF